MNGKRNAILVVLGILVILGSALSVVGRLWLAKDEGGAESRAAFGELVAGLGPPGQASNLADADRRSRLVRYFNGDARLLAVWVTDRDRGILWRLPDRSPYLPTSENFSRDPRPEFPALTTILLRSDWSGNGRRAEVDGLYVTVSQQTAFAIFRDAAIALGAWLLIVLLVVLLSGREDEEVRWRAAREPAVSAKGSRRGEAFAEAAEESSIPEFDAGGSSTGPEPEPAGDEEFSIPELEGGSADAPTRSELFSPTSGLGYESWLDERLGSELARAAAIEQDLSLLVMSLDSLGPDDEDYAVVGKAIREFFSFRDLAFERGTDGFSVILPNLDAAHALRMAEEFHKKLAIQLRDRAETSGLSGLPLYIGLSSRAGRLVEARRLGEEAFLALERAREDADTKIVAFKPDPDRYRLWLASTGG